MLAIKSKKYIWFPNQQGRRSSFEALINHYPLSDATFINLETKFMQSSGRSENQNTDGLSAKDIVEVQSLRQKLSDNDYGLNQANSPQKEPMAGRSPNNDNKKDNVSSYSLNKRNDNDKSNLFNFIPDNSDEERCFEIAAEFKEKNMDYILSRLKKYGIQVIERAYQATKDAVNRGSVNKPAAYFNSLIKKFGEEL